MNLTIYISVVLAVLGLAGIASAPVVPAFIHPGGLHVAADLDRMKEKVAAGEHPWINSWTAMCENGKAQAFYVAQPPTVALS